MPELDLEDNDITLTSDEGQPQEPPVKPTTPPPDDDLRRTMTELAGTVKALATPKQEERQMTQAEQAEMWAIYDPEASNKEFFKKWFRLNPDATPEDVAEMKGMFADMQKGLVKQSIVGARNLFQQELKKLREEFQPIQEHYASDRAEKTASRFYAKYPALDLKLEDGKRVYSAVIDSEARRLADKEFANEDEYFKALSEGAAAVVKSVKPDFDLGAKPQTKPAGTSLRLPRTSVGGTGGTGGGGGGPKKNDSGDDSGSIDW